MTLLSANRRYYLGFALLGSLVLSGCGGEPSTKVSGKITYQGKPLNSGTITFFCKNNQIRSCQIGPDGSYAIDKVPVGDAKISISIPPPPPKLSPEVAKMAPSGGAGPPQPVLIPATYSDPERSGLTYQVPKGSQPHDIDLK